MPREDETFIVRVRRREGDAVVEQPRLGRRRRVDEVSQIGPLILRWLTPPPEPTSGEQRRPDATTFRRYAMRYRLGTVLATAAMLAAGCGQDESPNAAAKEPPLASAAALERDPHALSCGHVTDQLAWSHETRRATVAIADGMRVHGLNRLQKTQSLFYAMTELCKGRPASHQPVDSAIEAVRNGTYRADLD